MEYSYFVFPSKYTKYNWSFRRLILNYPGNVLPTSDWFWAVLHKDETSTSCQFPITAYKVQDEQAQQQTWLK